MTARSGFKAVRSSVVAAACLLATSAVADTDVVVDNFDNYPDPAPFIQTWVPTIGLGTAPALSGDNLAGILTDDPLSTFDFPDLQGKAAPA